MLYGKVSKQDGQEVCRNRLPDDGLMVGVGTFAGVQGVGTGVGLGAVYPDAGKGGRGSGPNGAGIITGNMEESNHGQDDPYFQDLPHFHDPGLDIGRKIYAGCYRLREKKVK